MLVRHIGDVAYAEFERGMVRMQIGQKPSLTRGEKDQIRRFLKPIKGDDEVKSVKHVFYTTNIVECLF